MSPSGCEEVRELAAELALGIASGEERARAFEHAAGCAACRRELDDLASAADELLVLAPEHEPPLGFETRVVDGMRARSRERWRPFAFAAAAATLAALLTSVAMSLASRDDRRLASEYRDTLAKNNGTYFEAERLRGIDGRSVGQVFSYQGSPSWILVVLKAGGSEPGRYRAEVLTRRGRRLPLHSFRVGPGGATWAQSLPVRLDDLARIRLVGEQPGTLLQAPFEAEHER
jgi:putative zinc finger protein